MLGIKIPKRKSISIKEKIGIYNKMKYVYIPLISGLDKNITVIVKKGDYVYKGSVIGKRKGDFRVPILSSVSGTVIDYEEKYCITGEKVKCVVIENDFLDAVETKNAESTAISSYSKKEFLKIIRDAGIIGMGGSGFPTYVKYNYDQKVKTLIVNAVECEPYVTADYILFREKCEEILEAIDAILEINNIDSCIIAIGNNNIYLKELMDNYIGTYLKIKVEVLENLYPIGWEKNLVKKLLGVEYNKYPLEKGIIVNNVSTIYAIYEALKYGKPLIDRIVTFTGDNIKNPQNVLVKNGTLASEVIKKIGGTHTDGLFIVGSNMLGKNIPTKDIVITPEVNCILSLKEYSCKEPKNCIRCGKCTEVCPSKLSPILILESGNNIQKVKALNADKCIKCGLCSYICPSNIKLRDKVLEAKEQIETMVKK